MNEVLTLSLELIDASLRESVALGFELLETFEDGGGVLVIFEEVDCFQHEVGAGLGYFEAFVDRVEEVVGIEGGPMVF